MPDEVNEKRTIMNAITKRQINLIRHLLRYNRFMTIIIMEGKINGKRTKGKLRQSFFEEIFQWMDFTSYYQEDNKIHRKI